LGRFIGQPTHNDDMTVVIVKSLRDVG